MKTIQTPKLESKEQTEIIKQLTAREQVLQNELTEKNKELEKLRFICETTPVKSAKSKEDAIHKAILVCINSEPENGRINKVLLSYITGMPFHDIEDIFDVTNDLKLKKVFLNSDYMELHPNSKIREIQ